MIDDNHDDSEKTDEQREEHLNRMLHRLTIGIFAVEKTQNMFRSGKHTIFPDEAGALYQCKKDLVEVRVSIERRQENPGRYYQPDRIAELIAVEDSGGSGTLAGYDKR